MPTQVSDQAADGRVPPSVPGPPGPRRADQGVACRYRGPCHRAASVVDAGIGAARRQLPHLLGPAWIVVIHDMRAERLGEAAWPFRRGANDFHVIGGTVLADQGTNRTRDAL